MIAITRSKQRQNLSRSHFFLLSGTVVSGGGTTPACLGLAPKSSTDTMGRTDAIEAETQWFIWSDESTLASG